MSDDRRPPRKPHVKGQKMPHQRREGNRFDRGELPIPTARGSAISDPLRCGTPSPSRKETVAERVYHELAASIVTGAIRAGARLDEQSLARHFGVSRTPIREALRRLSTTGLVVSEAHRGATVVDTTPEELREMFEVMAELERACARCAAARMSDVDRRELERVHAELTELAARNDLANYPRLNARFHELIYRGSGNRFLEEQTLSVRQRLSPMRIAQFRKPGRLDRSAAEHAAIVRAIRRRDSEAAEAAMWKHVGQVLHTFEQVASAATRHGGHAGSGGSSRRRTGSSPAKRGP